MKAWSKSVFPPLTLTTDQETQFKDLARGLVRETLAHFDAFDRLPQSSRDLSKQRRWKAVKTRENLTVYKERDPPKSLSTTSFGPPEHHRLADDDWQMPRLLVGVGSIIGSLDDIMYGVVTPDAESMLLKAGIVRSSLVDGAVLAEIAGPTPYDPYHFLGIKWFVKGPPATLRNFVQPRDFVFVESTGIISRPNGDRIGYQLLHSVDLEGYGALPERSLTRGRISNCTIFKEAQGGQLVDVYVRGYVEQHGKLLDSVSLKAASTGFLSSWNSVECGHVKKLMWFVANPHLVSWKEEAAARARGRNTGSLASSQPTGNAENPRGFHLRSFSVGTGRSRERCGGTCGRKLKKGNSVGLCSLCEVPMCSKCRVTKKLAYATCDLKLERRASTICRSCVAKVRLQPARCIAQEEIRRGRYTWRADHNENEKRVHPDSDVAAAAKEPSPEPIPVQAKPPMTPFSTSRCDFNSSRATDSSSSRSATAFLEHLHQLQLQQAQIQAPGQTSGNEDQCVATRTKPRWFRRRKNEQRGGEARPVYFGEPSTTLSDCQAGTLSQCSTMDSTSTVSPVNPLAYSWASSAQDSNRARVEEDDEDDWANTPEFTESQRERQYLWNQMTELRLAVENTYQIAKHTTDSCCGSSFNPVGRLSP
ncbi:hypothetical protein PHYBOEH_003138 [Phytophthora boehmeriae]|uniref:FYVE-type domain-containing protein n=1 Tax=Phytophthora boehmeriae TaxID=109152 RepID=A0A8T1WQV9_9STRA|nr:hypothetical protein PHYBOEH_003138 [Phytophthora boehmeriae]